MVNSSVNQDREGKLTDLKLLPSACSKTGIGSLVPGTFLSSNSPSLILVAASSSEISKPSYLKTSASQHYANVNKASYHSFGSLPPKISAR